MSTATGWQRPEPFRNPWRAVAVVLLPLMILGLLVAALWNPQDRLDTVKAAIVNLDEPVKVEGETVPLGRQLTAGLVSGGETADVEAGQAEAVPASDASYDWQVTDASGAADGLADGTYAAVVTIPEGFSASATSFSGDDPNEARQATIDVATPPDGGALDDALARVVAQTATGVLGSTLTETYVDNVLVGFSTLSEQLGEASDGADKLADGAGEAGKGAEELADGAHQTSDGVSGVGEGVTGLAGGAGELSSGAQQWAAGADQAASGVNQLADGAGQSAAGASELATGADELAKGSQDVAQGAEGLAGGMAELDQDASVIPGNASRLAEGATGVSDGVSKFVAGLEQACSAPSLDPRLTALCAEVPQLKELEAGAGKVAGGVTDLAGTGGAEPTGLYRLTDGISGLASGAQELSGGASQVAGGASGLADGAHELSGGLSELQTGADQAASGVSELSTGARELSNGAGGLASGATELSNGVGQLETGSSELATGADGLADGVGELAGGAEDLSDGLGKATKEIPSYTEEERKSLSSVVADPVATDGEITDLDTGAVGPMFAVLALWLGALALMVVSSPVPLHTRGSTRSALRLTLGTFWVPGAIGAVTGVAAGAVLAALEGLGVGGWFATMGFGALVSVAFVAVNQALAAALGNLGRGLSLLVAVLVIATGVVATVPDALAWLAAFLPVGPAIDGLIGLVQSGAGGVGMASAAVVLWALAGLAVTTVVVMRRRTVRVTELLRTA